MLSLSDIPGRFLVGATTFVTPVRSPRVIGSLKLRNKTSNALQPALYLEEVAYTAYYPAAVSPKTAKKGLDWLIRPVKESLRGFARFTTIPSWVLWPVVYFFGALIKIPVYPNAPLLHPSKVKPGDDARGPCPVVKQWPLVIFSHGLGGSRTAYSQLCSRLAASGKVVLALEHRDGTGHACVSRAWGAEGKYETKPIIYYQDDDVILEDHPESEDVSPLPLRTDQLTFRREEIYYAYESFSRLIRNDPTLELSTIDETTIDKESWSLLDPTSDEGPICDNKNVGLAGHSFGACTVLSILSTEPAEEHSPIPITSALTLDPWLDPLPTPGPSPLWPNQATTSTPVSNSMRSSLDTTVVKSETDEYEKNSNNQLPRILVMNSETFTLWKDHYTRLQEVIQAWEPQGRRIVTLVGAQHATFSDFPALPLVRRSGSEVFMDIISKLSIAFFDGELEQALGSTSTRKMEIEIMGKKKDTYGGPKRKLSGSVGDIIIS